jgi:hypothetical protein
MATRPVSGDNFRAAMTQVATPVSVVTTVHAGTAYGTTVSAFLSLSMHPPMVLVSLDTGSNLLAALQPGSPLGVNVLAADQGALARQFATKNENKFAGIEWQLRAGAPCLPDLHVWIAGPRRPDHAGRRPHARFRERRRSRARAGLTLDLLARGIRDPFGNVRTTLRPRGGLRPGGDAEIMVAVVADADRAALAGASANRRDPWGQPRVTA